MLPQLAEFPYFLWLNKIPCIHCDDVCMHTLVHVYTTHSFFGHWVISMSHIFFEHQLLWIWRCIYLFSIVFSFLWDIFPEMGFLGRIIVLGFFFEKHLYCLPWWLHQFTIMIIFIYQLISCLYIKKSNFWTECWK